MAKIKNRDKRKKAAVKKANQVKAGKPEMYEGYMKIPPRYLTHWRSG